LAYGGGTSETTYPNPQIDPRDKGFKWILDYTRAAYRDSRGYMPFGQLNTGMLKMSEIKMYALGKQPVDKYKKMFSPGNPTDESWRAIDWTVPAFMCKFREIAISKLIQKKFDITAYPVDPLAISQEDAFFNQMKVKIIMREEARKSGSPLADSPLLQAQPGEPDDMEQLLMQREYGYKHEMAIEAEDAINLVYEQNNIEEIRKQLDECLYDWGIGGLTQQIDENGMVKLRVVNPEYLGLSYCEKSDFSDLVHWFEIVPTYVADLAPYYTREQLDDICKKSISKNGNPTSYYPLNTMFNQSWSRFKVMVLKIKFLSWNDTVYKEERDSRSNMRFGKTSYKNKQFLVNNNGELKEEGEDYSEGGYSAPLDNQDTQGQQSPKYLNSCKKVVYKASWVLDTEYMHDWGLQENQNRKLSSWWDTDLDIQLYAWDFYKMQFTGITERLIPFEDKACMAWFNLQNLSNKLIPYLINIEMNAVEGAGFGKGGQKMKPAELVDFIFSNFIVPWRATDLMSRNPNFKPVSIEATGQLAAFGQLYDQLNHTIEMMRQISGLNELTDGSTPNAKTLIPVAESAIESTNNAIYLVSDAEKNILLRTANAIVQKVQIAVKLGKVAGYAKALGSNTVKFFNINPDISLYELGIFITDALTEEQRQMLWQDINIKESQGFLDVADKAFLMQCRNTQQAYQVLGYKIQKRKEQMQQFEMQKLNEQTEGNAYVAQASEMAKQDTLAMQLDADLIRINAQGQWEFEIERMKKGMDVQGEAMQVEGRTLGHQIQADAKIIATHISAEAAKAKERMKPKTKSKAK
jgi:hypothetical protein